MLNKIKRSAALVGELQPFSASMSKLVSHNLPKQCRRSMTTSRRVQDRSKKKRVHALEKAVETHKILSKILLIFEVLKQEPEQIVPLKSLDRYRQQITLPKPHKFSNFLRKSPKLFELYKDQRGMWWCGMTTLAENLIQEEERIIEEHSDQAAEYVTRMLMMSTEKRLPLQKIAHFRRDFGLPLDFRTNWVHKYPEYFKVVKPCKPYDESEYLELVNWKSSWAITELEKKASVVMEAPEDHLPGVLSLSFPTKFPPDYKKLFTATKQIQSFQNREYRSPYANPSGLKPGSQEFNKRAVAVMHELLSFTIEKRLVTDHLTHFRNEFVMPQKLMRLLLKHFGIFYVSERGKRFHVFLNEAYEGSELIEKHPLVLWKERLLDSVGYRKKKSEREMMDDFSDEEDPKLFESDSEDDDILFEQTEEEITCNSKDGFHSDSSEMDINEIYTVYKD